MRFGIQVKLTRGMGWDEKEFLHQQIREIKISDLEAVATVESVTGFFAKAVIVLNIDVREVYETDGAKENEMVGKFIKRLREIRLKPGDLEIEEIFIQERKDD